MKNLIKNQKILYKFLIYLLSFPFFSLLTRWVVAFPWPRFIVRFVIKKVFIDGYGVNWKEAQKPIDEYRTIVSFFVRKLKPNSRDIDLFPSALISPVDAKVMDSGNIAKDKTYLVKGKKYSLIDLIGEEKVSKYLGGSYVILYLAPKDYHRIHHIKSSNIKKLEYFPGRLLPVNMYSLLNFDNVFGKNKRVLIEYDALFSMVLVGALNVGKIEISDFPDFYKQAQKKKSFTPLRYQLNVNKKVSKGDEAGIFYLGSTVVLLFEKGIVDFKLKNDETVKMGEKIGKWL